MSAYELYAERRPNDRQRQYIGGRANERAIIRLLARTLNSPTWPYGHEPVVIGPRGERVEIEPRQANALILRRSFRNDPKVAA
jgi:hypothetical protein